MTSLDITEVDFEKLLGPEEDSLTSTSDIIKLNPEFITSILSVAVKVLNDSPGESEVETLYITVKHFLSQTKVHYSNEAALSGLFSTYIESYRGLKVYQNRLGKDQEGFIPVDLNLLYNEAALSVFDLYLQRPTDPLVRRLLIITATAINEIISSVQSQGEDRPIKEVIADMTNFALMTHTLKNYIKGTKRSINFDYIRWLKDLLTRTLATKDISFVQSDETLKNVIAQIKEGVKIIVIPH